MSIQFESVSKTFGNRTILNQVSFSAEKGEILFILGKSGMGKSVTLKHIIGLLKPSGGAVRVDGLLVSEMKNAELPKVRQKCGMVFQHPALLDSLSIFQNISFGLRTPQYRLNKADLSESQIYEKVLEKLALVNLSPDILERFPNELSYGMQKRASLARTLAPEPAYLLFDEPTTGLDPITTTAVNDLIFELSKKLNVTSIVVSHDMGCALKIADRILVLDQGKILAMDTVEMIKKSKEPLIQDFLKETLERTLE